MKNQIVNFLKSLPKKSNIPVFIYFAINLFIMLFANTFLVGGLFLDYFKEAETPDIVIVLIATLFSIIMYAIGIVVSFSPVGDWLVRFKNNCNKIEGHEQEERISRLFNEVLEKARKKNPDLSPDIKIFINEDEEINAFAFGRKTVCITSALLECSDDEIKGVIAHELGHISNGDTDLLQVVNVANVYVTIYAFAVWLIMVFYKGAFKATTWVFSLIAGSIGEAIMAFLTRVFIDIALTALITVLTFAWKALGNILIKESMRMNEFEADKFACSLGYAKPFITLLNKMRWEDNKKSKFQKAVAYMSTDHPSAESRLRKLKSFYCAKA